jgi:lysyl-tRNA synthetase class 2
VDAAVVGAVAVAFVAWGIIPADAWRSVGLLIGNPGSEMAFGRLAAVTAGIGILLLARGLWRGNRQALAAVVAALTAGGALAVAQGDHPVYGALAIAGAGLLAVQRKAFVTRGGTLRVAAIAAGVAIVTLILAALVAILGLVVTGHDPTVGAAASAVARWVISGHAPPSDDVIAATLNVLVVIAFTSLVAGLRAFLGPEPATHGHDHGAHERAAALLAEHAADSLDAFVLRPDKSFHFAHGGVLAYRTIGETAVVSGDPIGPCGSAPAILADFRDWAARRGWSVVVTAASTRHLDGYRALGMRTLRLGDESVVDPAALELAGGAMKSVRKAVNRVHREGWTVTCRRGSALDDVTVRDLARVEAAWRRRRPRLQGFAMTLGRLWGDPADSDSLYVLGRDAGGELKAFLRFADYPGGLSLDVMRRLTDRPNGINEALIVAALRHAAAEGITEVSLNFAGFSHLMAPDGPLTPGRRLARRGLRMVHGRFQLERLARFNAKFFPVARPRYLVYPSRLGLPLAALRVLQAEAYAPAPRDRPLPARWEPAPHPVTPAAGGARS